VKRAQFPFNAWLLAAIRAPTPISSLVHSSTLVVAGVFILLQYSYCLVDVLDILKYLRILRLILRRFGLINEGDIKKLIAYSTLRHVSLIMYMLRFKFFKIVYFHLNIHAMFKSLMFICFGFVILYSFHRQDKRLVSYTNLNPVVKIIYYFSCLCLAGLPIIRGFFSKDFIIEKIIEFSVEMIYVVLLLLFLSLRIYYSIKLLLLNKSFMAYRIFEKNFLGIGRVLIIMMLIIVMINVYLTLVFSLTLEFFSIKIRVYLLIFFTLVLRIFTNLNYKISFYSKLLNFKEI
jgi:NADH:ubiquinone oxidoreductase subunit 5 (subunit L)/multisubunit Na+/H+ antiporter MnhA subunit